MQCHLTIKSNYYAMTSQSINFISYWNDYKIFITSENLKNKDLHIHPPHEFNKQYKRIMSHIVHLWNIFKYIGVSCGITEIFLF